MQPATYPLTPAYAASAYGNPGNLVGGHDAVTAPWQIQDRHAWGAREASYYEQVKQEREDNTAAILQYIQTKWNSWVQLVAAPQRYDYWRGQKISTRIRVTPMGLLPDQGIPPNVKFTSEITEFELDLVGIGVHWDLAQSNTQKFMTEASAVANLIASFEFTAKQAVISSVAQQTMSIAQIIAFFKAGQTVTIGTAMQLVNMIFGVANKGGSDLALLLNKIKEQVDRRQTFLNTMLAPSSFIQAPAFINYWDLPRTGTQIRSTPELAYKIQGWVENVFEVTGILMSNDKVSSGLSTQYHKGSWFSLKVTGNPALDYISVTNGADNSMTKLRAETLVQHALNFDENGVDIYPDMTARLFGAAVDQIFAQPVIPVIQPPPGGQPPPPLIQPPPPQVQDFGFGPGEVGQVGAHGATFEFAEAAGKEAFIAFAALLTRTTAGAIRVLPDDVADLNLIRELDLSIPLHLLIGLTSYNVPIAANSIIVPGRTDVAFASAIINMANQTILRSNATDDQKAALWWVLRTVVNILMGTASDELLAAADAWVRQNSASNAPIAFASLARDLKKASPGLSNEMAILKAALTVNKLVDSKQLKSLFDNNRNLQSALNALSDMGVDRSHIEDQARICKSAKIQDMCFNSKNPKAFSSAITFGVVDPTDEAEARRRNVRTRLDRNTILGWIRNGDPRAKNFQILIGRQFQEGEGTSVALLEPGGKAVKLYIGQPTFGSGFNSSTMMAQATLRMMMGVAVTPTSIATLPHVHLTDFNPKTFGVDFIDPEKLRQEDGFAQAADGRLGSLWVYVAPANIEFPPVWTIKGSYDIPQLQDAAVEPLSTIPLWQQHLKMCMNYDDQSGLDAMRIDPDAKVINEIMERGVWNIADKSTVNPCDAFGLPLSGANSNPYKNGGYANGVNSESAGYYRLAAVN